MARCRKRSSRKSLSPVAGGGSEVDDGFLVQAFRNAGPGAHSIQVDDGALQALACQRGGLVVRAHQRRDFETVRRRAARRWPT